MIVLAEISDDEPESEGETTHKKKRERKKIKLSLSRLIPVFVVAVYVYLEHRGLHVEKLLLFLLEITVRSIRGSLMELLRNHPNEAVLMLVTKVALGASGQDCPLTFLKRLSSVLALII